MFLLFFPFADGLLCTCIRFAAVSNLMKCMSGQQWRCSSCWLCALLSDRDELHKVLETNYIKEAFSKEAVLEMIREVRQNTF